MRLNLNKVAELSNTLNDTSRAVLQNLIQMALSCNERDYFNASISVRMAIETLIDMGVIISENKLTDTASIIQQLNS